MLTVKETLQSDEYEYQITNEFGKAQPFTVLNLYRHIGYPMRVVQNEMSNGKEAVINLAKRYLPITIIRYGEERLRAMYGNFSKTLPTFYAQPIEKVLKAYRRYNEKTEFYRTPETEAMLKADRDALVPVMDAELTKYFITANNKIMNDKKWQRESVRGMFIEILAQRMLVRMMIEDTLALKMESDPEANDIDTAQAKALTAMCGGNKTGVDDILRGIYKNNLEALSLTEIQILFNKLQYHLEGINKAEKEKYEQRMAEKAKARAASEVDERAKDPNRRGKTVKGKRHKPKARSMDESLAALQDKFNRQHV